MEKILIISGIPARNDTNSGKTIINLFEQYQKDKLYQLYSSPMKPNSDLCRQYFQLNELDVIKKGFGLFEDMGNVICNDSQFEETINKNNLSITKRKNQIIIKILRECIWKISNWKCSKLQNWLKNSNPTVIFAILQDTIFSINLILWVSEQFDIPIYLFITDDYYNDQEMKSNKLRKLYYKKKQSRIDCLLKKSTHLFACSEIGAEYFSRKYHIKHDVLYTPSAIQFTNLKMKKNICTPIKIRYFGNLDLGRWEILEMVGKILSKINLKETKAILEIYSSSSDASIIKNLNINDSCFFRGWVQENEYLNLLQETDISIHVESFNENMIRRTWMSVSTKIADYLGAGKCIMAIGPSKIASISYLKDVAYVIDSLDSLESKIYDLINDIGLIEKHQILSKQKSINNHNQLAISNKLYRIINRLDG